MTGNKPPQAGTGISKTMGMLIRYPFVSPFSNYAVFLADLHTMLVTYYGTQNDNSKGIFHCFLSTTCSPETVESLFIAYRLTGDVRYREYGWKIFQSIEKHCRLESGGYASILNVDDIHSEKIDKMETFFMV